MQKFPAGSRSGAYLGLTGRTAVCDGPFDLCRGGGGKGGENDLGWYIALHGKTTLENLGETTNDVFLIGMCVPWPVCEQDWKA